MGNVTTDGRGHRRVMKLELDERLSRRNGNPWERRPQCSKHEKRGNAFECMNKLSIGKCCKIRTTKRCLCEQQARALARDAVWPLHLNRPDDRVLVSFFIFLTLIPARKPAWSSGPRLSGMDQLQTRCSFLRTTITEAIFTLNTRSKIPQPRRQCSKTTSKSSPIRGGTTSMSWYKRRNSKHFGSAAVKQALTLQTLQ